MDHWMSSYNPENWSRRNGWSAGTYAGPDYEQGSFELNVIYNFRLRPWIKSFPWYVLNYLPKDDQHVSGNDCPKPFAVHYWSGNRAHISKHWS